MVIHRILNNNVISIIDEDSNEKVVMGRGIGFKKQIGDEVDQDKIEKIFVMSTKDEINKLQELIVDIPIEYLLLAENIVNYTKMRMGKKLNDMLFVGLVDHIYTAVLRYEDGITVKNVLLWDIKRFYPDEFHIGQTALKMIENEFKIELPQDEAGFIALHIVNASLEGENLDDVVEISSIMQQITNIVKYEFKVDFNEDSVYFYRFITHLKFFAKRLIDNKTYEDDENDLLDLIKLKYRNSYHCVLKIMYFLKTKYDYTLSNEEQLYLTIHIERVIYKTDK